MNNGRDDEPEPVCSSSLAQFLPISPKSRPAPASSLPPLHSRSRDRRGVQGMGVEYSEGWSENELFHINVLPIIIGWMPWHVMPSLLPPSSPTVRPPNASKGQMGLPPAGRHQCRLFSRRQKEGKGQCQAVTVCPLPPPTVPAPPDGLRVGEVDGGSEGGRLCLPAQPALPAPACRQRHVCCKSVCRSGGKSRRCLTTTAWMAG